MTPHPIDKVTVTQPVSVQNLTIFPLTQTAPSGPEYIASSVAIEKHGMQVTEISDGGSVPNLLVKNPSEHYILLLDGEELWGAKQNRIINTTVLLAPRSETIIDVSCTESGRWSYSSPTFSHSGSVMPTKARRRKMRSVSHSLHAYEQFNSDQGEVWNEVSELHMKVGSNSPTSAMADAYEKMRADLDSALDQMPVQENQCGMIVMIDGKPAGLDLLSRGPVYKHLHPQLIKSYAMEAIANERERMFSQSKSKPKEATKQDAPDELAAKAFFERCAAITGKSYRSVGVGMDWRFIDESLVGSGLEVDDTWIHMAYFVDEADSDASGRRGRMTRMSQRRRYHRRDDDDRIY
jgi:hypothetical protein